METLTALQEHVEKLIKHIRELKSENVRLEKENKQLLKKIESTSSHAEDSLHALNELNEEKEHTKLALEDVIKTIDSFIQPEQ